MISPPTPLFATTLVRFASAILLLSAVLVPAVLVPGICLAEQPHWNQWRGPARDGALTESSWPEAFKGKLNLLWEKPHGPSYSGPVINGTTVFTTETIEKKTERVTAYDLSSGTVQWQAEWPGSMAVPFFAASNGDWIRSTPACNNDHLVVLGMRDVLVSLHPKTGDEQWRVDFSKQLGTPLPAFGAVCSPLIDDRAVYVQTGGNLAKVSLSDGSVIWKSLENAEGMMSSGAFSSPTIATIAGKRQLLVQTREALCGVELDTGKVLWKQPIEAFRGMNILTPLVIDDKVFTSAHSGKAQLFRINHEADNDVWSVTELWTKNLQAYMSSPVLVKDTIYMHMKNERVCALDVADGNTRWTSSPMGKYWSMITNGKKILGLESSGQLRLIEASDSEFKVLDKQQVAENAWAHLAVEGDLLVVRDLASIKVFRWK